MGSFNLHWEATTGVPPTSARDWFFDLRENDHDNAAHREVFGGNAPTRKILSKAKDQVVTEEHIGKRTMKATLRPVGADALQLETTGKGMSSVGTLKFVPDGKGSRIVVDTAFKTSGLAVLFTPMIRRQITGIIPKDMAIHVKEMEKEWKTKPW